MSILTTQPDRLRDRSFQFDAGLEFPGGRIELWEQPDPTKTYVIGADGAYGIEGRDFDAACVFIKGDGIPRQVAEAHGHWGERFDRVIYALHRLYGGAFVCMERAATGLPVLRRLYDDFMVRALYYERSQTSANLSVTDKLGFPTSGNDLVVRDLRLVVETGQIIIRSRHLMDQMERLQWKAANEARDLEDRVGDAKLQMKLPGGGSPDLVMAAAFGLHAWREVIHYVAPKEIVYGNTLDGPMPHDKWDENPMANDDPRRRRKW